MVVLLAVKNKISRSYSLTAWLFIVIYIQYVVFILFSLHSLVEDVSHTEQDY